MAMKLSPSKPCLILMSSLLLFCTLNNVARADRTSFLAMFRQKQSVSNEAMVLKAENGPWLILAATLSGEEAQAKAKMLANEIRTEMRLASFIMHKPADDSLLGVGERIRTESDGTLVQKQLKLRYANGSSEETYAVLVGEFTSTEDPRIKEVLQAIRTAQPKSLGASGKPEREDGEEENLVQKTRSLFWWQSDRAENLKKGPMGAAFVTRNPLLPADFFQSPKVDDFVSNLNKQVKYSLLDCPGRFTVRVASFYGNSVTDLGASAQAKSLSTSDALDKAAEQANTLTVALREQGEEAFQFHDRYGSFVTIGSFDKLGEETPNGFVYQPEMLAIISKHCGYRVLDVKNPQTGAISKRTSLKSLAKIPFDVDGKPMAVPRPETNSVYRNALLGGG